MKEIIWLASYPKSGNTWVRCLLDAYFLGSVDINELLSSVSDDTAMRFDTGLGDIRKLKPEIQMLARPMSLLRLVLAYQGSKKLPLFVKTHCPNSTVNGIELLPPHLTKAVIYLMRDPADVAPSFAKHFGIDVDTAIKWMQDPGRIILGDDAPTKVSSFVGSWKDHVQSYTTMNYQNTQVFRYEDLRADTVKTFSEMLEHAGVDVDTKKVRNAVELTELSKLREQEDRKGFREASKKANRFFGEGKVNGSELVPRQRHILNKIRKRNYGLV